MKYRMSLRRRLHLWLRTNWYWLKCRLWHRYNVVHIHSLPPTWNDRDQVMLHAAFQVLVDFVQKEKGHFSDNVYELYRPDGEEVALERAAEWETIRQLYCWWLERREDYRDRPEDNAMFHKLINVRKHLWT